MTPIHIWKLHKQQRVTCAKNNCRKEVTSTFSTRFKSAKTRQETPSQAATLLSAVRYGLFKETNVSSQTYRNKLINLDLLYGDKKVHPVDTFGTGNN